MKVLSEILPEWFLRKFDSESRRLFRNSTWVLIANINTTACFFIRSIILARGLGVENFGLIMLIAAATSSVIELVNLNLPTSLIKFGADFKTSGRTDKLVAYVKTCFLLTAVTSILSLLMVAGVMYYGYEKYINQPGLQAYILFYALGASLVSFNGLSTGLLRLYDKFRLNSIINIITDWMELIIVALVVIILAPSIEYILSALALALLLKGLLLIYVSFNELRSVFIRHAKVKIRLLRADWGSVKHFVLYNSPSNTLQALMRHGDVLMLGVFSDTGQIGLYTIAKRLGYFVLRVTDPLTNSMFPQLAGLISGNRKKEARLMLFKVTSLVFCVAGFVTLVVAVFSDHVIGLVYGPEYLSAVSVLRILLMAGGVSAIFFWTLPLILSMGKVKLRLIVNIISMSIAAILAIILIPVLGAAGAALAMLVIVLINKLTFTYVTLRELH